MEVAAKKNRNKGSSTMLVLTISGDWLKYSNIGGIFLQLSKTVPLCTSENYPKTNMSIQNLKLNGINSTSRFNLNIPYITILISIVQVMELLSSKKMISLLLLLMGFMIMLHKIRL